MRYLPHTPEEVEQMLGVIGVSSMDALFDPIPKEARFERALSVPPPMAEPELMALLQGLAAENHGTTLSSFLGAGLYAHHIPPAVDQLLLRSEFYTAYTPYQPEVAQGTLQAIWEFQTIVSELFGLPLANASMYDGATAAAEGVQMARRLTRRNTVLVSECVHPEYRGTIATYVGGQDDGRAVTVGIGKDGGFDETGLLAQLDDDVAACVVGYPSFFGTVKDLTPLARALQARGALLVTSTTEPYALGALEPPGALGADIATGEGQALATTPNFGGPGVGLFACRDERKYLQQLPGRICGETVDKNGKRGFVLTLSTREQHIRRERATSNICTNQGLIALSLTIRTSMLGKVGFQQTARACHSKARYLAQAIAGLDGYALAFDAPFFNEFAVRVVGGPGTGGAAARVHARLIEEGFIAGLDLGRLRAVTGAPRSDLLLLAVTEKHTKKELDRLVAALGKVQR
jgi:glycine dehydrogenase subunit 1